MNTLRGKGEQRLKFDESFQIVEVHGQAAKNPTGSFIDNIFPNRKKSGSRKNSDITYQPVMEKLSKKNQNKKLHDFLKNVLSVLPIDWDIPKLKFNKFPASVNTDSRLVQVHYLFQMLGVGVIFVVNDSNELHGKISREDFINLRYKESDLKRYDLALDNLEVM